MSADAMQAAIDRIEHDSEFARLVYEDSQALLSDFDLTAEECAAVRDPLVSAIDAHLGEVRGFVSFDFAKVEIVYTPQSARDAQTGLPSGKRMYKPFVVVTEVG